MTDVKIKIMGELENKFIYKTPSPKGIRTHQQLSELFIHLADWVLKLVPAGREQSLALTKLEEAKFWASAGVARNEETR